MDKTSDGLVIESNVPDIVTRTPPIFKLDEDVLWQIFFLNTNRDNDVEFRVYPLDRIDDRKNRALFITWVSAHVCRQWRSMIVNSPLLWAQLVDLDGFSSVGTLFKEEVMRRTGSSTLYIYGSVFAQNESERDFFISIFARNWPRFRIVKVTIDQSKLIPAHTWKVLFEPARFLEVLYLRSKDGMTLPVMEDQKTNLLSDDAPSLRKFVSWRLNFSFGDPPGWMSSVRHLHISYMTLMSIAQWLHMLEQIPQIERLDLIKPFRCPPDTTQKFPSVHLPNLVGISIIHELAACVVFLDHLLPRAGCYLRLNTPEDMDDPLSPDTIALTKRVLSRYSENWFNNRSVESLYVSVSHKEIIICEYAYYGQGSQSSFAVQISCQMLEDLPTLFPLLDAFSSCKLDNITTLHFEVDLFPDQTLTPEVFQFLLTLPAVETLKYSKQYTIQELLALIQHPDANPGNSSPAQTSLFPRLHTILLDTSGFYDDEILQSIQEDTSRFLTWRQEVRRPVGVLDVTALENRARINMYDGILDLKVVYQTEEGIRQEHVCRGNL